MKKKVRGGLALLTAVVFAVVAIGVSADDENLPEIVIEKMRFDMGEVFEAEKYEYKFLVKNTGKADLVIEKVQPS